MTDENNNFRAPGKFSRAQKFGVAGLAVLGFLVVLGWGFDLVQRIQSPIQGNVAVSPDNSRPNSSCPDGDCSQEEELRNKDTDGDGLSDWEELNVHDTSPYLEDTDGDGIMDGEEVERGSDPNCPQGRDCNNSQPFVDEEVEVENDLSDDSSISTSTTSATGIPQGGTPDLNLEATSSQDKAELEEIMQGEGDPDTLREMLLQSGMNKEMLDQVSDEELMESYEETINNN